MAFVVHNTPKNFLGEIPAGWPLPLADLDIGLEHWGGTLGWALIPYLFSVHLLTEGIICDIIDLLDVNEYI